MPVISILRRLRQEDDKVKEWLHSKLREKREKERILHRPHVSTSLPGNRLSGLYQGLGSLNSRSCWHNSISLCEKILHGSLHVILWEPSLCEVEQSAGAQSTLYPCTKMSY